MTYSELKTIVGNHITRTSDKLPQDTFTITRALNLRLKNSTEAKQDFGNNITPEIEVKTRFMHDIRANTRYIMMKTMLIKTFL